MNSTNPYLPPAFALESGSATNFYRVFAARLLILLAAAFGLVVVCYAMLLGFEWSTPGANILPSAWYPINVVGISGICGLIAAIIAARWYSQGRNRLSRMLLVFFVLVSITSITMSVRTVFRLGQEQARVE